MSEIARGLLDAAELFLDQAVSQRRCFFPGSASLHDMLQIYRLACKSVLFGVPSVLWNRCVEAPDVDLHAICKISTCPSLTNAAQMQPEAGFWGQHGD